MLEKLRRWPHWVWAALLIAVSWLIIFVISVMATQLTQTQHNLLILAGKLLAAVVVFWAAFGRIMANIFSQKEPKQPPQRGTPFLEQQGIDTSRYYHIVSKVSNDKCLDVFRGRIADRTKIQLYAFHGSDNQQWKFMPAGNGNEYCHIVSKLSHLSPKCLDVYRGQTANETPVELYSLHGGENQQWELIPSEREYFHIVSRLSKLSPKCLTLAHGETADGTPIELYSLHGSENQQWKLVTASE